MSFDVRLSPCGPQRKISEGREVSPPSHPVGMVTFRWRWI